MSVTCPKKIAIIGLPGSGKSTYANVLGKAFDLPIYHLDNYLFTKSGEKKSRQEWVSLEKSMVEEESWIIEGCSISTLDLRFARADVVLYLKFPRLLCIWRVFKRLLICDEDLSKTGCKRLVNWRLLSYIWTFYEDKEESIETSRKKYPDLDFLIFTGSGDVDRYIQELQGQNPL